MVKRATERIPFPEDRRPGQPVLEVRQRQRFEQDRLVARGHAPADVDALAPAIERAFTLSRPLVALIGRTVT